MAGFGDELKRLSNETSCRRGSESEVGGGKNCEQGNNDGGAIVGSRESLCCNNDNMELLHESFSGTDFHPEYESRNTGDMNGIISDRMLTSNDGRVGIILGTNHDDSSVDRLPASRDETREMNPADDSSCFSNSLNDRNSDHDQSLRFRIHSQNNSSSVETSGVGDVSPSDSLPSSMSSTASALAPKFGAPQQNQRRESPLPLLTGGGKVRDGVQYFADLRPHFGVSRQRSSSPSSQSIASIGALDQESARQRREHSSTSSSKSIPEEGHFGPSTSTDIHNRCPVDIHLSALTTSPQSHETDGSMERDIPRGCENSVSDLVRGRDQRQRRGESEMSQESATPVPLKKLIKREIVEYRSDDLSESMDESAEEDSGYYGLVPPPNSSLVNNSQSNQSHTMLLNQQRMIDVKREIIGIGCVADQTDAIGRIDPGRQIVGSIFDGNASNDHARALVPTSEDGNQAAIGGIHRLTMNDYNSEPLNDNRNIAFSTVRQTIALGNFCSAPSKSVPNPKNVPTIDWVGVGRKLTNQRQELGLSNHDGNRVQEAGSAEPTVDDQTTTADIDDFGIQGLASDMHNPVSISLPQKLPMEELHNMTMSQSIAESRYEAIVNSVIANQTGSTSSRAGNTRCGSIVTNRDVTRSEKKARKKYVEGIEDSAEDDEVVTSGDRSSEIVLPELQDGQQRSNILKTPYFQSKIHKNGAMNNDICSDVEMELELGAESGDNAVEDAGIDVSVKELLGKRTRKKRRGKPRWVVRKKHVFHRQALSCRAKRPRRAPAKGGVVDAKSAALAVSVASEDVHPNVSNLTAFQLECQESQVQKLPPNIRFPVSTKSCIHRTRSTHLAKPNSQSKVPLGEKNAGLPETTSVENVADSHSRNDQPLTKNNPTSGTHIPADNDLLPVRVEDEVVTSRARSRLDHSSGATDSAALDDIRDLESLENVPSSSCENSTQSKVFHSGIDPSSSEITSSGSQLRVQYRPTASTSDDPTTDIYSQCQEESIRTGNRDELVENYSNCELARTIYSNQESTEGACNLSESEDFDDYNLGVSNGRIIFDNRASLSPIDSEIPRIVYELKSSSLQPIIEQKHDLSTLLGSKRSITSSVASDPELSRISLSSTRGGLSKSAPKLPLERGSLASRIFDGKHQSPPKPAMSMSSSSLLTQASRRSHLNVPSSSAATSGAVIDVNPSDVPFKKRTLDKLTGSSKSICSNDGTLVSNNSSRVDSLGLSASFEGVRGAVAVPRFHDAAMDWIRAKKRKWSEKRSDSSKNVARRGNKSFRKSRNMTENVGWNNNCLEYNNNFETEANEAMMSAESDTITDQPIKTSNCVVQLVKLVQSQTNLDHASDYDGNDLPSPSISISPPISNFAENEDSYINENQDTTDLFRQQGSLTLANERVGNNLSAGPANQPSMSPSPSSNSTIPLSNLKRMADSFSPDNSGNLPEENVGNKEISAPAAPENLTNYSAASPGVSSLLSRRVRRSQSSRTSSNHGKVTKRHRATPTAATRALNRRLARHVDGSQCMICQRTLSSSFVAVRHVKLWHLAADGRVVTDESLTKSKSKGPKRYRHSGAPAPGEAEPDVDVDVAVEAAEVVGEAGVGQQGMAE